MSVRSAAWIGALALVGVPGSARAPSRGELERPRVAFNASAAVTSGVDALGPGGALGLSLSGRGTLVGQWDQAGVRVSHADLRGRVAARDGAGVADHATHVAGTIAGDGTGQMLAMGMAPEARVWSFGWELDLAELRAHAPFLAASNHAYGYAMGGLRDGCDGGATWLGRAGEREDRRFGKYGPEAAALDAVIYETSLASVWAGGNERQDVGVADGETHYHLGDCETTFDDAHASELALQYDTLGLHLAAKNALVVGAAAHVPSGAPSAGDVRVLSFSGYGPMDDGRIKPDLVASGELVFSTIADADDGYQSYSGTSSSAAVVSGGIALLVEHYRALYDGVDPRADELKALLVHTARSASDGGAPSYESGYGLFDARAAAELLTRDAAQAGDEKHIRLDTLAEGEVREYALQPGDLPLRVVLAWSDPPAAPNRGGVDDDAPALVNDLDAVLIAPSGSEHHPWSLDPAAPADAATREGPNRADNVEVIDVPASHEDMSGAWTLRVSLVGRPHRLKPQPFAVVSSGALSEASAAVLWAPRQLLADVPAAATEQALALPVRNRNPGPLAWRARSETPWLSLDAERGTAPARLEARIDTSQLPRGRGPHLGRIVVGGEGTAAERTIGVVARVRCTPDCTGRACGPDPVCGSSCGGCALDAWCTSDGQCAPLSDDACANADLGSALGPALLAGHTQGRAADTDGSCGGAGEEVGVRWVAPDGDFYRLSTSGSGAPSVLHVRDGCDGDELACGTAPAGGRAALTLPVEAGAELFIFADSEDASARYLLSIERAPCPDVDLGSRLGAGLAEDTSAGLGARLQGSCGGAGEEAVFAWTAPRAGTYRFAANNEGAVLYVRDGGCGGAELGCARGGEEALELALEQGQRVAVVVDAETDPARFRLDVHDSAGLCLGSCGGSPNDGGCFCDPGCVELGDCCEDACESCGSCCVPACEGRACGPDGCGGRCGSCNVGELCDTGACVADPCVQLADGAACDDADPCTEDDRCVGGRCAGVATAQACEGEEPRPEASGEPDAGAATMQTVRENEQPGEDPAPERPAEGAGCACRAGFGAGLPVPYPGLWLFVLGWVSSRWWARR